MVGGECSISHPRVEHRAQDAGGALCLYPTEKVEELGLSTGLEGLGVPTTHSDVDTSNINSLNRQTLSMHTNAQVTADLKTEQMTENLIAIMKYG